MCRKQIIISVVSIRLKTTQELGGFELFLHVDKTIVDTCSSSSEYSNEVEKVSAVEEEEEYTSNGGENDSAINQYIH